MSAIAGSYWRRIKAGARSFEAVPASMQENVLELAKAEVKNGTITAEEYKALTGLDFDAD